MKNIGRKVIKIFIQERRWWLPALVALVGLGWPGQVAAAPGDIVNCALPFNISNSEGFVSVDPLLIADRGGLVHLFWSERVTGAKEDSGPPDAVMYAVWDGETWSEPIDIFLSPPENPNRNIGGIRGVIDDQGVIHLVWIGPDNTFFYSAALASEAGKASGWQKPYLLAKDQTGTQYSADIAYSSPQTMHVLYGRSVEDAPRTVSYVRSVDGGRNWSQPVDIYTFTDLERGASNIRMLVAEPDKIYASWTEWDTSGNGQAVLFVRSLDGGNNWDYPVILDERVGQEYERDWNNLAVLDENQLIAFWEGGFRAYPQAQYSNDGGVTWSEPIDTFYWLIADNGYVNFAQDGAGRLHAFVPRRIREGYDYLCDRLPGCASESEPGVSRGEVNALWHSVWEGGTIWREPLPAGGFQKIDKQSISVGGNFTSAVIFGGNQMMAAWFDYSYYELIVMRCEIEATPAVAPQPWPNPTPVPTPEFTSTPTPISAQVTPLSTRVVLQGDTTLSTQTNSNPGSAVMLGIVTSVMMIAVLLAITQWFRLRN